MRRRVAALAVLLLVAAWPAPSPAPVLPAHVESQAIAPAEIPWFGAFDPAGEPAPPPLQATGLGHDAPVTAVAAEPSQRHLLTGDQAGTVHVWHVASGDEAYTTRSTAGAVEQLALTDDGLAVAAYENGDLRSWHVRSRRAGPACARLAGRPTALVLDPTRDVAFSSDETGTVRACSLDGKGHATAPEPTGSAATALAVDALHGVLALGYEDGFVRFWDIDEGREARPAIFRPSAVTALAFAPDGADLWIGTRRGGIETLAWERGEDIDTVRTAGRAVTSLVIDPQRRWIAFAEENARSVQLWSVAAAAPVLSLRGHGDSITALASGPDAGLVLSASEDRTARIWDLRQDQLAVRVDGPRKAVRTVAIDDAGRRFAVATEGGRVLIVDARSGFVHFEYGLGADVAHTLSFTAQGKALFTSSTDGWSRTWRLDGSRPATHGSEPVRRPTCADRSADGTWFAVGDAQGDVVVGLADGDSRARVYRRSDRSDEGVSDLAFFPDGQRIAIAYDDGLVHVVDVAGLTGGTAIQPLQRTERGVVVAVAPDGQWVATGDEYGTIGVWRVDDDAPAVTIDAHKATVTALAFSGDGRVLVSGARDQRVHGWLLPSGTSFASLRVAGKAVQSMDLAGAAPLLVVASGADHVELFDLASRERLMALPRAPGAVTALAPYDDGEQRGIAAGGRDGIVRVWDVDRGQLLARSPRWHDAVESVAADPADGLLWIGLSNHDPVRWNARRGELPWFEQLPELRLGELASAPPRPTIVGGQISGGLVVFHRDERGDLSHDTPGTSSVTALSIHPSANRAAVADDQFALWDVDLASGERSRRFFAPDVTIHALAHQPPHGRYLAGGCADGTIRIWDTRDGTEARSYDAGGVPIVSLAFSRDGKQLASGSSDGTIRLWRGISGDPSGTLVGHVDAIHALRYVDEERTLISGGVDGLVRVWDTENRALVRILADDESGAWSALGADRTLVRADGGDRWLRLDLPTGEIRPLEPPAAPAGAELVVQPTGDVALRSGTLARLDVPIANRGTAPARQLRIAPAETSVGPGLSLVATGFVGQLDAGQQASLPVWLAYSDPVDRDPVDRLRLALFAHAAGQTASPARSIDLPIETPAIRLGRPVTEPGQDRAIRAVRFAVYLDDVAYESPLYAFLHLRDPKNDAEVTLGPSVLPAMQPGDEATALFAFDDALVEAWNRMEARPEVVGSIWPPSDVWTAEAAPIQRASGGFSWLTLLATLALLTLGAGVYQVLFRDPVVRQIADEPARLRELPLRKVPGTAKALARIRRLQPQLDAIDVPAARWQRLEQVARGDLEPFVRALDIQLGDAVELGPGVTFHPIELPRLLVRVERTSALIVRRAGEAAELPALLAAQIRERSLASSHLLLLDLAPDQTASGALEGEFLRICVIGERDVTGLMLAADPAHELARLIAARARLGEISPYQTGGGVANPALFFGRQDELALLGARETRSHLLIGARQMGKTSILLELRRRAPQRAHLVVLSGAELDDDLLAHGLPPLDGLLEQAPAGPPPMLLVDEADALVRLDRERGYPQLRRIRSISEAGRCRFVLAGYWELHRSAYLEHQSPIRNFGEPLRLGPLDPDNAHRLATVPMASMGIRWDDDDLVDELLARTGCRPNLVSLACNAAVKALEPLSDRVIDREVLERVLDVSSDSAAELVQAFGDVGALTDDPRACAIDRAVMYATVDRQTFSISRLKRRLQRSGARLPQDAVRDSLERLSLAYVLERKGGRYRYPVPLLRQYLLAECDHDPTQMLADEIVDAGLGGDGAG